MQNAIELKTGIEGRGEFWGADEWFTLWLCGQQVGIIVGRARAVSQLQGIARTGRIDLIAARAAYLEAVAAESAPEPSPSAPQAATARENAAPVALPVASESRARCPHYRAIRRAFAIAREKGLDVRADEAMRAAFGRCLGHTVETRECMNGGKWQAVGDAMKRGLAW